MVKKKLIYIMGAGRSGSTLLDVVLGNAQEIFSCGEIIKFPSLNGCPHGFDIGSETYALWKRVETRFLGKNSNHSLQKIARLAESIENHKAFLLTMFRLHSSAKVEQYREYINDMVDAISEETGRNILVDSSKYPGRALALLECLNYDVYVIYLKRNPVDVVLSFRKRDVEQPPKSFFAANVYLFVIGLLCFLAVRRFDRDRCLTMTYEEFLKDPAETLARIEQKFQVDLSDPIYLARGGKPMRVGKLFEGNRIRLRESIVLVKGSTTVSKNMGYYVTRIVNYLWY